jgi:hypothetical protein
MRSTCIVETPEARLFKRLILIFVFLCGSASGFTQPPKIRISGWYWLNSAPRVDWRGDFVTMKSLGFTDVLLGWGLDVAAVGTRVSDTRQAIQWAHQAGLRAYLFVWQPTANSLPRHPDVMQVDSEGHQLDSFDVFNPDWRATEWKDYLQKLARAYGHEPGMAGYVFDDSFEAGGTGEISYGAYEQRAFGKPLPRKPGDPRWDQWVKAREGWWQDWARDTVHYIRAVDPDPQHEIYLEDYFPNIVNPARHNSHGLDFSKVALYFDAVGGYTTTSWDSSPDSGQKAAEKTTEALNTIRKMIGDKKQIIYTFWVANQSEERNAGAAQYPTADQIRLICEAALRLGIRHLDMYGYRIGDYVIKREDMARWVPPEPLPYKLTGQFPQKFLWDRPQIHQGLADYLRSLNP